ncbi:hypothetical protein EC991_000288 [Linnemannia zychae]|nr:hypothetical protein EC991_000288 [Linnemannia zychae]
MIHTSPNGFESGFIRSAITSTVVTTAATATTASATTTAATAVGTTATTAATGTATSSTLPAELRLKSRLQRIIRIPPSVAQTHSNKATASTSTNSTNHFSTVSSTATTPASAASPTAPKRGLSSRIEKKLLVGATAVDQDGKTLLVTTATTRLGSGTDPSAPLSPASSAPVSDSSPDSSEKNTETNKVDQHLHNHSYYYSPDPMPQRQLYTVGSSLLAKAKVKARALQNNLLPSPPLPPPQQRQQDELDPLTKFELHKGNQEEGADGRGSNSDGTDVESNASNSNTNTISVGTSQHLKSLHHYRHHNHRSSVQLDNVIMSDSDPQPDNSHDPSNDSDSTVTDHHPHNTLLSPPTPRSRRCSIRSGRNSIGPDENERPSSPAQVAAEETTTALLILTPAATPPLSLPKEIAAGVQEQQQEAKEEEEAEDIVASLGEKKPDTISETLVSGISSEPAATMMTTQDLVALYEAIFQRQHLTEEAIAGSLHELRQLILAYGIPEQVQY